MNLTSKTVTLDKSAQNVCDFLSHVKNFEQLMPENTAKFELIGEQAFVFALKGMPEIALELKEINAPNQVVLGAKSDKLPFTLTANIEELEASKSATTLDFEGDFNAMMAMMIKGPIKSFLESLTDNLQNI
ncbi:SRPBCC family protein [Gilvibacter sediminis]|uniref:SRPBCC family protein n=1 Tax=Gilvibacter sediminis TaxID=379071 RepID=UPI00235005DA|nr:SRPBCC family protein [Gilvibacter sediminis]MDC7998526.1 SRPBCC family protein [Gilvibacter sediminis]